MQAAGRLQVSHCCSSVILAPWSQIKVGRVEVTQASKVDPEVISGHFAGGQNRPRARIWARKVGLARFWARPAVCPAENSLRFAAIWHRQALTCGASTLIGD